MKSLETYFNELLKVQAEVEALRRIKDNQAEYAKKQIEKFLSQEGKALLQLEFAKSGIHLNGELKAFVYLEGQTIEISLHCPGFLPIYRRGELRVKTKNFIIRTPKRSPFLDRKKYANVTLQTQTMPSIAVIEPTWRVKPSFTNDIWLFNHLPEAVANARNLWLQEEKNRKDDEAHEAYIKAMQASS